MLPVAWLEPRIAVSSAGEVGRSAVLDYKCDTSYRLRYPAPRIPSPDTSGKTRLTRAGWRRLGLRRRLFRALTRAGGTSIMLRPANRVADWTEVIFEDPIRDTQFLGAGEVPEPRFNCPGVNSVEFDLTPGERHKSVMVFCSIRADPDGTRGPFF